MSAHAMNRSAGVAPAAHPLWPKLAWQITVLLMLLGAALPLKAAEHFFTGKPAGPILTAGNDRVMILSPAGDVLGQYPTKLTHDAWLLPNGNIVIGCYRAYSNGEGCGLLEISRDKKLIWRYSHPKGDGTMMPVELLSPEGRALSGPCLR